MIKKIIAIAALAAVSAAGNVYACTSLIAAPGATQQGSSMITYAADSHVLYGELYNQPAADHPKGAMRKVIDWDGNKYLGEIPEVAHTYATIGNMNEHGLTIAESTWNKMSPAQQQIVTEAAKASADYDRQMNRQQTEDLVSKLEEAGMKINYPELAPFAEATASVLTDNAATYGDLLTQLQTWLANK